MWACVIEVGKDADGRRKRRTIYAATVPELERAVYDARARGGGAIRPRVRGTLGEWVADWLRDVEADRAAATLVSYEGVWRIHVEPVLGTTALADLRVEHVTRLVRRLRAAGTSPSMIARCLRVMNRCLSVAIRQGRYHGANPFGMVEKPRVEDHIARSLSLDEAGRFLEAASECEHAALWVLLLTGGLRLGEALALRWSDVDLQAGTVSVTRSHSEAGGRHFKSPKNRFSRRTVNVGPLAVAALKKHKPRPGCLLVFHSNRGTPLLRSNLHRQHFQPVLKRAKITGKLRIHDLRHTSASIALASGVPIKAAADRLGQSTTKTLLAVYAHSLQGADRAAATAIDQALSKRTRKKI